MYPFLENVSLQKYQRKKITVLDEHCTLVKGTLELTQCHFFFSPNNSG